MSGLSSHDHGNCELCDEIETKLTAAEARVERLEACLLPVVEHAARIDRVHALLAREARQALAALKEGGND